MTRFLLALVGATLFAAAPTPRYSIQAIRYATEPDIPVSAMALGAPKDQKVDAADVIWLIRGGDRNILLDSGCHRDTFLKESPLKDYLRPDLAVEAAGVKPEEVTDIVISHAHYDHMGGIDLFPRAQVWIQREEYRYYTSDAWQPGGNHPQLAARSNILPTGIGND